MRIAYAILTHASRIELPLCFPVQLTLRLSLTLSLSPFLPLSNKPISLSLSLSLSLPASPKYPRPLPIPYADVHPALLSIRSAHYAAFTCAHDRPQQRRQIRSSVERRNRAREYLSDLNLSYILPRKLSAVLRRVLRRCRSARAYDPRASARSNTAARRYGSAETIGLAASRMSVESSAGRPAAFRI